MSYQVMGVIVSIIFMATTLILKYYPIKPVKQKPKYDTGAFCFCLFTCSAITVVWMFWEVMIKPFWR